MKYARSFRFPILLALCCIGQFALAQEHAAGRILVKFKESSMNYQRQQALDLVGGRVSREIGDVAVVELNSRGKEAGLARAIANSPHVEFAEIDRRAGISEVFVPNDPWYTNWQRAFAQIQCPEAWYMIVGSPEIIVAIIDTGVDGSHPDLAPNMVPGWDVIRNRSDSSDVMGHGTKVAGIVGAVGNNGVGVASMTLNCSIMSVRVADETGTAYISDIADGIIWAADHGARVANVSINCSDSSTVSSAAQSLDRRGGVCVIGAGNDGMERNQPDDPYELVVGAVDGYHEIYYWSDRGPYVDLTAPGANYTTYRGGNYGVASGTSISSPHVAGAAALLYSLNPALTGRQVQDALIAGAMDKGEIGYDTIYGAGVVNPYQAMLAVSAPSADTTAPSVSFITPTNQATVNKSVTVSVSATDDNSIAGVSFKVDGVVVSTKYSGPFDWSVNTTTLTNGSHRFESVASDQAGNVASVAIDVTVSNLSPDTVPPLVEILKPTTGSTAGSRVDVTIAYSDNVAMSMVELRLDGVIVGSNKTSFRLSTRKWAKGSHAIQAKAVDSSGNVTWSQIVYVNKL